MSHPSLHEHACIGLPPELEGLNLEEKDACTLLRTVTKEKLFEWGLISWAMQLLSLGRIYFPVFFLGQLRPPRPPLYVGLEADRNVV